MSRIEISPEGTWWICAKVLFNSINLSYRECAVERGARFWMWQSCCESASSTMLWGGGGGDLLWAAVWRLWCSPVTKCFSVTRLFCLTGFTIIKPARILNDVPEPLLKCCFPSCASSLQYFAFCNLSPGLILHGCLFRLSLKTYCALLGAVN